MATAFVLPHELILIKEQTFNITGTTTRQDIGAVSRRVICYKNNSETEVHAFTTSSAICGSFSLSANGNENDVFRVIALGRLSEGENCRIKDNIRYAV